MQPTSDAMRWRKSGLRTRFAPSPTGDLHLGGALVALVSYLLAKRDGGQFVVRMEDLDLPRTIPGAETRILEDLNLLGLFEDEGPRSGGRFGPYVQRERTSLYLAAIEQLRTRGLAYPCTCSRAEVARMSSAPHLGEEGPRYSGNCRSPDARKIDHPASIRVRVDPAPETAFFDIFTGYRQEDVATVVGDFVLQRSDSQFAYQLAVALDDVAMEIDLVVRGDDLLGSTGRQVWLAKLLGFKRVIQYGHIPVVCGPDGRRLAKRHQGQFSGTTIRELVSSGVCPGEILGEMGASLGLNTPGQHMTATELVEAAQTRSIVPTRFQIPASWVHEVNNTGG